MNHLQVHIISIQFNFNIQSKALGLIKKKIVTDCMLGKLI